MKYWSVMEPENVRVAEARAKKRLPVRPGDEFAFARKNGDDNAFALLFSVKWWPIRGYEFYSDIPEYEGLLIRTELRLRSGLDDIGTGT